MNIKRIILYFFLFLIISFCAIACTPTKRYVVLSFFFDGVPEPFSTELTTQLDSLNAHEASSQYVTEVAPVSTMSVHLPYAERECSNCHTEGSLGKLVDEEPQLCYTCHENMANIYPSLHGPVKGGYCTSCHDPHKSNFESLVKKNDKELCLQCHDAELLFASVFHDLNESENCTNCHNPHGGENSFNLVSGTCTGCHDSYSDSYEYVHGPVASGYCNTCHTPHGNKSEYLLLREGQNICTYCHIEVVSNRNETHRDIGDTDCLECHDPHGGQEQFLFN